jgi:hypothetical protein
MENIKGDIGLSGHIFIKCIHVDGTEETRQVKNIITAAGKAAVAEQIIDITATPFTALEIGFGTSAATTAETTLVSALTTSGLQRKAATVTRVTTDDADDTAQLVVTWTSLTPSPATIAVTEVGAFNLSSGGTMLGRQVFAAVNMVEGDKLEITYKFDVD